MATIKEAEEYRRDARKYGRHITFESNSLEAVLRWLSRVEERKYDKRFPWRFAYIYKRSQLGCSLDNLISFNFK